MGNKRVLCIPDTHLPYLNKAAFTIVIDRIIPKFKPHIIIQMGDLYDLTSWSRFPKSQLNPKDELLEARACAEEMWRIMRKRAPRAKCFQLVGNHDASTRVRKLMLSKAPELEPFISINHLYQFPHVETINDPKEELIIDNWLYTHGHRNKVELHLQDIQFMHNIMMGHLHIGQDHFVRVGALKGKIRAASCCGLMANPFHPSLVYRPLVKYFKWTTGVSQVEDGWPKFIPIVL